jgi:uncharacterized membrane protein YgaE (UPF0421/DUF939 family)
VSAIPRARRRLLLLSEIVVIVFVGFLFSRVFFETTAPRSWLLSVCVVLVISVCSTSRWQSLSLAKPLVGKASVDHNEACSHLMFKART